MAVTKTTKSGPDIIAQARSGIANARPNDPFRGPKYTTAFIVGTVSEALDGLAKWGQRGFKLGAVGGVAAALVSPAIGASLGVVSAAVIGAGAGFALCAALGAFRGFVTGGYTHMSRASRGDRYAEDLIKRQEIRSKAPVSRADYRDAMAARRRREEIINRQGLDIQDRTTDSTSSSFVDRVLHSTSGQGRGF